MTTLKEIRERAAHPDTAPIDDVEACPRSIVEASVQCQQDRAYLLALLDEARELLKRAELGLRACKLAAHRDDEDIYRATKPYIEFLGKLEDS